MSAPALVKVDSSVDLRDEWTRERIEFVRKQYCGGAPDAVAAAFIDICQRRRLAPEEKHAYLTRRGDGWVIQTGIDGYRLIADRTRAYAGSDDPVFDTEDAANPNKATVTVWKMVGGVRCPFTASARWSEYCPADKRQGFMWTKMPYLMLGKCAEGLALRKAFPAELSGIYTDAEMDQAGRETKADNLPERQIGERTLIEALADTEGWDKSDGNTIDADPETGEIIEAEVKPAKPVETLDAVRQQIKDVSGVLGFDAEKVRGLAKSMQANYATLDGAKQLRSALLGMLPDEPDGEAGDDGYTR